MAELFFNTLFLRVLLSRKIFFPLVVVCLLLVLAVKTGVPVLQAKGTPAQFKKEWHYKAAQNQLNPDAEQPVPARYSGNGGQHGGHPATGKVLQFFFLPGGTHLAIRGYASLPIKYAGTVHDFVPLLRLLLFPKHWFW